MENWKRLKKEQQINFLLTAMIKTWLELGSKHPSEFYLDFCDASVDKKGFYLVFVRQSGAIYFTLTFTYSDKGHVQVIVTPYRYRRPDFKSSVVLELVDSVDCSDLVSHLHKDYIEVLLEGAISLFENNKVWYDTFESYLSSEVLDFREQDYLKQMQTREIKDIELELTHSFNRLARMYGNLLRKSKLDSVATVKGTSSSELSLSTTGFIFEVTLGDLGLYTFEIQPDGEEFQTICVFALSDAHKYLTKFEVYVNDFKEGDHLANLIPKEHQLTFLKEIESCIISLGLWGDYFISTKRLYK